MGNRANLFNRVIGEGNVIRDAPRRLGTQPMRLCLNERAVHTDRGEYLTDTVMQLSSDMSPFFVSQCCDPIGEHFKLPSLAMEIRKDPHFCSKQLWNDRHGNIVHSPVLIPFQAVEVAYVNTGDEHDRG